MMNREPKTMRRSQLLVKEGGSMKFVDVQEVAMVCALFGSTKN
jgi:hypothetical protein